MDYPLISQNPIDGRWEARFDGVEIAGFEYSKVEDAISQLVNWRAQKEVAKDSMDRLEQQRQIEAGSGWQNATGLVVGLFGMAICVVIAMTINAWPMIREFFTVDVWTFFGG